jgi:hypothetical protein
MNLQIKKFDPRRVKDDSTCVFIGRRRSGKSTLVTDMLWYKRHIPVGVVMSGTEEGNHHYKQFVPDLFIHGEFNKGTIQKIIDRQKFILQKRGTASPVFLLLDDLMFDRSYMREKCVRELFFNGRHWKVLFMVTMQDCLGLDASIRGQGDYVFVLKTDSSLRNLQRLYEHFFGGVVSTFKIFKELYDKCTENYECLVIDNTSLSSRIEDRIFYYKANIRSNFRIGSSAMWSFHKRHYAPSR